MSSEYFALFGLAPVFPIDEAALKAKYFSLQREFHPDRVKGVAALEKAAEINHGYQLLKDPLARAEYLLSRSGTAIDKPSQAVLIEAMEQREALAGASDAQAITALKNENAAQIAQCVAALEQYFAQQKLPQAAELAVKLKYLTKFAEELRLKSIGQQ